jgi:hypothetical protein
MANILNLITIGEKKYYVVDANPSAASGTSAEIGSIAVYDSGTVGTAYLKTGALDTAWDRISTTGTSGIVNVGVAGRMTVYPASGNTVDDEYIQNSQSITVSHVAQAARSAAIVYSIPNPGNAVTAADFVLTEGSQIINGAKTFGNDVTVNANMTVNGTLTYINSTQLQISDPVVTLNKGGVAASAGGAGIEFEEGGSITGYMEVSPARTGFTWKAPAVASTMTMLASSLTANRTYTVPDVSGTFALGSGAAGNVAFWSGANTLSANANFFFDNTNTRLGIGNGAPSVALHVTGSARITSLNTAAPVRSDINGNLANGAIVLTAASDVSGILPVANGGTNSSTALNNNRIMISSGGAIVEAAALTNGQLLIGSTGAAPVAAAPIQGAFASVTISLGAGSITLDTVQDIRTSASPSFVNATLSGKTAGSVIFAGAGGSLSQDNATFFWDNTNKRLGLGNATPARQLDVTGSSIHRGAIRYADAGAANANWEMFQAQVATTDATATTLQSIAVATDSVLLLEATIVGRRTGGSAGANGDVAVYKRTARFKNIGGTVTISNLQSDYTSEDQPAWNGTLDVSGASARIRVTGAANNNINWTCTYTVITLS